MAKNLENIKAQTTNYSVDITEVKPTTLAKASKTFIPPTHMEVGQYFLQREPAASHEDAVAFSEKFIAHYEQTGWYYGKKKMKNWKMAVISAWDTKKFVSKSLNQTNHGQQNIGRIQKSAINEWLNT